MNKFYVVIVFVACFMVACGGGSAQSNKSEKSEKSEAPLDEWDVALGDLEKLLDQDVALAKKYYSGDLSSKEEDQILEVNEKIENLNKKLDVASAENKLKPEQQAKYDRLLQNHAAALINLMYDAEDDYDDDDDDGDFDIDDDDDDDDDW